MMSLSGLKSKLDYLQVESLLELTELLVESDIMHHCFWVQELYQIPKADYKTCSSTLTVCCNTLKSQKKKKKVPYRNFSWPESDILILLNFITGLINSWHSWKSKTIVIVVTIECHLTKQKILHKPSKPVMQIAENAHKKS